MPTVPLLALLGPLSSASTDGPGRIFSWIFFVVGTWVLAGVWRYYLKHRRNSKIRLFDLYFISAMSVIFVGVGIRGLLR